MKILDVPQSGSLAGVTSSRNRFGQYRRTRAIPVNPGSTYQGAVRARLSAAAAAWRTLTAAQRAGWAGLGALMTRTDALGQAYTLDGFTAYLSVRSNLVAAGDAALADAPALITPSSPILGAITLTIAAFTIAYTPTPLGAAVRMFTYVSLQRSAGRAFEADRRLLQVSAVAAISPIDAYTAYVARFGVPVVGNRIFVALSTYEGGFVSAPTLGSAVVA